MVENAIIFPVNVCVRLVLLGHFVKINVRRVHTVNNVNQSVNAKMMVYAIHRMETVNVRQVIQTTSSFS